MAVREGNVGEESHYEFVIVGGGTAGITVASRIQRKCGKASLAIVEPSDKHYYQPLWTLVGAGEVKKEETARPEQSVIPRGAEWIRDSVSAFHPGENAVTTLKGRRIGYDYLVVAAGIQIDWGRVKGLRESIGKNGVCSNYAYEYVDTTWEFLSGLRRGNAIFTFPNTETKCGGAPQKIMWLADHHLRRRGHRQDADVWFVSAKPGIFGVPHYARTLNRLVEERNIKTRFRRDLVEIDAVSKIALFKNLDSGEIEPLPYELLHVTPPQSAPDFIKQSPLASADGWVDVDQRTLQHKKFPNIFSLGDASSLPTAKTGAAVRKQAPVLVQNLLSQRAGEALRAAYDGYTSCPLVTGYGRLVLAEFDYEGRPVETFPFDQSRERRSMYLLKRYLLPVLYWHGMLKGRA